MGNFCGRFMQRICLKAPGNYSGSIWSYKFSICLWENPNNFIYPISGFLDVSLKPKTNIFYLWRPQDTLNKSKKRIIFEASYICRFQNVANTKTLDIFERRAPENPDDPCNEILKYGIWDQDLPENTTWRNFDTKKLWNQDTKKPITFETMKPKSKKPRNQGTFYFQVRESPAPINIPTPTPRPRWSCSLSKLVLPRNYDKCIDYKELTFIIITRND